jgi:hypothetical protein
MENIVRYTSSQLREMQQRAETLTDWDRLRTEQAAGLAPDLSLDELPEDFWEHAVVLQAPFLKPDPAPGAPDRMPPAS